VSESTFSVSGKVETVGEMVLRGVWTFYGNGNPELGGALGSYGGGQTYTDCVSILMCNEPWAGQTGGSEHVATPLCHHTYTRTTCTQIYSGNGIPTSVGYGNSRNPHRPGGGSGSSNNNSTTNNTPITVTVAPPKPKDEKKCTLFNKLKIDAPFKNIVNTLKYATTQSNINYEQGAALTNQANGSYNAIIGTPDPDKDYSVAFNIPAGTAIDIMIHNHYVGGLTIFSPADLDQIYQYIKTADMDQGENYVSVVITPNPQDPLNPSVYAITITDKEKFISYGDDKFSTQAKFETYEYLAYAEKNAITESCMGINNDHTTLENENRFLKMIKNSGLKVHKANADLSQWNPLALNNNGTVALEAPCN
jgi:hypothetical protein